MGYWLPLVLLAGLIPGHLLERKFDKKRYQLIQKHTAPQRRLDYLGELMIRRETAAEIRLFGLESHLLKRWQDLFFNMRQERLRLAFARFKARNTGVISDLIAYSLVLTGIVALIARGSLSVGSYVACLDAVVLFRDAALMLFNGIRNIEDDLHYLSDLLDYLKLKEETHMETGTMRIKPAAREALREGGGDNGQEHRVPEVRFEDVTFRYPGSDTPALNKLNLTLHPGERIALVGENGAGKTTLSKLLLGLYRPTDGQITINGQHLCDLNIVHWRKKVGAVFQDYTRYQITARENIGFGDLNRLHDDAAIRTAADKSGASEVIAELSSGYETILGRIYDEKGQDLSTGQWQKLAIARAYFRDAQVLVLDEPTAALDARSEVEVYRQFQEMSQGKSVLLISHRLGSTQLADRIVFLDHGQITEEGSHQTLMQNGGQYADMFALQAEWYKQETSYDQIQHKTPAPGTRHHRTRWI
jgi:ATP-binding cassette subfamily B protein